MNKAQLVEEISNQTALAKKTFRETVDTVILAKTNPCPERKKSF